MPPYKADDWDDLTNIGKHVNLAPAMPAMDWVLENKHWPSIIQAYLASTTFVDHQVGKLLDALDASPFAKNTFIVLWSDHGYHMGEKGRFAKQSLWQESSRVPLIIAGPEIEGGARPTCRCSCSISIRLWPISLVCPPIHRTKAIACALFLKILGLHGRILPSPPTALAIMPYRPRSIGISVTKTAVLN